MIPEETKTKFMKRIPFCKTHNCRVEITFKDGDLHINCPKAKKSKEGLSLEVCEICYIIEE